MIDLDQAAHLVLQVGVILLAAKAFGVLATRVFRQPAVLGEVAAGMAIGPYALGGVAWFGMRPLFPAPGLGGHAVGVELYTLALLASAVLLFRAGLETDVPKFLKYSLAGLATGLGGALLSFVLGAGATVWTGFAEGFGDPTALFMGTVATATSVGVTARVLSERRKMDTAEGATVLSGAVIDDIIGLVLLAMVLSIVGARSEGGAFPWARLGWIAAKAVLFWVLAVGLGIAFSRPLGKFLRVFGGNTSISTATLALAFLLAAFAEKAGLALIIGAYIMGLSLSRIDRATVLQERLAPVYDFLVPMFFCIMGMSMDFRLAGGALLVGLAFAVACAVGKVGGCGLAALPMGFNLRGAARIGVGMMPRQEVALIVAGIALASGGLAPGAFGGVVVMTFLTTLAAPPLLARLFDDRPGLRREEAAPPRASAEFEIKMPSPEVAKLVAERLADSFRNEGFFVHFMADLDTYEMRKGSGTVFMEADEEHLRFRATPDFAYYARMIVLEEMVSLRKLFNEAANLDQVGQAKSVFLGDRG